MNPIPAAKWGGALAIVALIFGSGWTTCKWHYEAAQAAQLRAVARAYEDQVLAREAGEAKLKRVQDAYDAIKDLPDPITLGLAHRVYIAAAGGCPVSQANPLAPGTQTPAALTLGPSGVERALGKLLEACAADSAQLNAVIQLAP